MNETAVSPAAGSPAYCPSPRDHQKDGAAQGTRHSRSAPGKSRGRLRVLCGSSARSTVNLLTFGLAAVLLAGSLTAQIPPSRPAAALYRRLQSVGLDANRVYQVRDAALDRQDLHLSLNDGLIAFTDDVEGRTTGAFFEGEGEVLLVPPDKVERASLALFTREAVLEERFSTAYFRFFDDRFLSDLEPALRPLENPGEFVVRWNPAARTLAQGDALRLLAALTSRSSAPLTIIHARLGGARLGTFDVFFDTGLAEQISVGQMAYSHGAPYYDAWLSFPSRSARANPEVGSALRSLGAGGPESTDAFTISRCQVRAHVLPPRDLEAEATLDLELGASADSERTLFFELSRYLKVSSVTAAKPPNLGTGEAQPLEFIQNEALEGSELARRGNDVVAVVFPEALHRGQRLQLRFVYSGSVLSDAGGGLLYVGARGIWYPNRGLEMTNFDLEFRYPPGWTLLATGKRESLHTETDGGEQVARWLSERPLPVAGFNLGQYLSSGARAGETLVESFAARGVEASFPQPQPTIVPAPREALLRAWPRPSPSPPLVAIPPPPPAPAVNAPSVAQRAAAVINFLSSRIGPFPYSSLALTQMPGQLSQGWPGLVFLSTPAWLNPEQRTAVAGPSAEVSYRYLVIAHETAHQWWGDAVYWRAYRDQWVMEALANYCALMSLEAKNPNEVRAILEHYRQGLLEETAGGGEARAAGPVTLGTRLSSSRIPRGYEVVGYGRGTWLFHMLRHMLRDSSAAGTADPDRLFFHALRSLQQRYQGKQVSTVDVLRAMEEVLPASLDFEGGPAAGRDSLDWFLQGWVNGTAIPGLALRDVRIGLKSGKRLATGKIIQRDAPEDLVTSVPIYADIAGARPVLLGRVFADGPETSFRLTAPAATRKLLLDPYKTVLSR